MRTWGRLTGCVLVVLCGLALATTVEAGVPIVGDFDGDGLADVGVYDNGGNWRIRLSSGEPFIVHFGNPALGDTPIVVDWDSNGLTDLAVFRQSTGDWFVFLLGRPELGARQFQQIVFGAGGGDVPVMHDFDGDGLLDVALFRPSTSSWFLLNSRTGEVETIPLP